MKAFRKVSSLLIVATLFMLGACSQARRSIYAGQSSEELWEPVALCTVNLAGYNRMGCFSLQLSIDRNLAYIDVQELLFNPATVPYRVLARPAGGTTFQLLANNVTVGVGGTIEVKAKSGLYIENYEEWRIELSRQKDSSGLNLVAAEVGTGLPVVQDVPYFQELEELPATTAKKK